MNELSLFTGAGGGLLGTKLLGWKALGYVEYEDYCQRIIAQRIKDGIIDDAPIFSDIDTFISEGYADAYQGMVNVVTAGFPCQPFSIAGKGQAENDERNMWPETIEVIRRVRPQYALLENVPGLFNHKYIQRIFGDLAEAGYDARWDVISAAECGAPHLRKRVWIVADSKREGLEGSTRRQIRSFRKSKKSLKGGKSCRGITEAGIYWKTEPRLGRVAHGVADRVDRIKAIGNGQVPAVVREAWNLLNEA